MPRELDGSFHFPHGLRLRPVLSRYSELKPYADLRTVHPRVPQKTVIPAPVRVFIIERSITYDGSYLVPREFVSDISGYVPGDVRREAQPEAAYISPDLNEEFVYSQIDASADYKIEPALASAELRVLTERTFQINLIFKPPVTSTSNQIEG